MKTPVYVLLGLAASVGAVQAEELKPASWVLLPAIGSSPETGFQYGAYVMRQFEQTRIEEPQDRLEFVVQGTTKSQFQAFIWPDYYVAGGDWNLSGKIGGKYWPTPYFGQSNDIDLDAEPENYELTSFESEAEAAYRITPTVWLGGLVFLEYEDITDDDDETLLNDSIRGFDGGLYTGLGLSAAWDTRNDRDWPTEGSRVSAELRQYTPALGSEYDFGILETKASHYIAIDDDVLALGANYQWSSDTTPFTRLPRPSGSSTLRGADGNRWSDHQLLGTQIEYRMTLTPRWAITGSFDTAQVGASFDELGVSDAHTSLGAGVRWATMADARFNIRFDLGWVDMESVGIALTVGEAF